MSGIQETQTVGGKPEKVTPDNLPAFAANFPIGVNLADGEYCWTNGGLAASFRPSELDRVWTVVFGSNLQADDPYSDASMVREVMLSFWKQAKPDLVTVTLPDDPDMVLDAIYAGFTALGSLPLNERDYIIFGWRLSQ
ncbi:hypothetical protein [uncultured Ruegeria sp.]|uniref:hypothetical protein n=1 Tax=uncultured Ruegeria sp. TaxID=259304 RepID=UPI00262D1631|nr:hypothetical protein [uncultured Ruegeria sp.]